MLGKSSAAWSHCFTGSSRRFIVFARNPMKETADEHTKNVQCQGSDCQRWSLHGLRQPADEQANHRYEFSGRVGQMDCGTGLPRTSSVRAVPLRTERDETLLRRLACEST